MAKRKKFRFYLPAGTIIADKYEIIRKIGAGWEGEVYLVKECFSGIERAVKIFYPDRNKNNRRILFYARKLHKLRYCPILIQYHNQEILQYKKKKVRVLVSEYVHGTLIKDYLKELPGKRMNSFEALRLLYDLAEGVELVHNTKEYHGDLHYENIIIRKQGIYFYAKLIDMFNWGQPSPENIRGDVFDLIRIFYDCLGGAKYYSRQPQAVKSICCGLKRTLIQKKFRNAGQLKNYIKTLEWE